jgi:hypothetical protein
MGVPYKNVREFCQFRLAPSQYHEPGGWHLFNKIMECSHLFPERKQTTSTTGFLCCGFSGNLVHAHCSFQGTHTHKCASLGVLAMAYSFTLLVFSTAFFFCYTCLAFSLDIIHMTLCLLPSPDMHSVLPRSHLR